MDDSPADDGAADPGALPEGTIDSFDDEGIADMGYETDVGVPLFYSNH
jgi:hypothetical protein